MGKHFWTRHIDDESNHKQPGCMWGLANVLAYHHRNSNLHKMIHYSDYESEVDSCDWSPKTKSSSRGSDDEIEQLLDEKQKPHTSAKRSRRTKKRSLRARIKALIVEEVSKKNKHKKGSSFGSKLQRTYSIHHLESLDGSLRKICQDLKNPIIFFPGNTDVSADTPEKMTPDDSNETSKTSGFMDVKKPESRKETDVLEVFNVDKELFAKHLQESDENIVNLSRAFGLNSDPVLSKSRSFPSAGLSKTRKLKPIKLENKQKEVWSVPKRYGHSSSMSGEVAGDRFQRFEDVIERFQDTVDRKEENTMERVRERPDEQCAVKRIHHHRSSSLNESLDKYSRLFENSYPTDAKLHVSKSLKLMNEHGHGPMYFRRIRSLSNVESYYSDLNFGMTAENTSSGLEDSKEEEKIVILLVKDRENVSLDAVETGMDEIDPTDGQSGMRTLGSLRSNEVDDSIENVEALRDEMDKLERSDSRSNHRSVQDSGSCLLDTSSEVEEPQLSEELKYMKSFETGPHSSCQATKNLDTDENSNMFVKLSVRDGCPNKNSDLYYVHKLLDVSGITKDAFERAWHASDQPLGPELFEDVESRLPHERDELNGWPDFYGCWQHQMIFNLVNEVLLEIYDLSFPYYPKPLSSSCRVRPFPVGNHIVEEVSNSVVNLMNLKTEENQSLDGIVSYDFENDHRWMNLQLDSECTGLELEDMIFDDILEEILSF